MKTKANSQFRQRDHRLQHAVYPTVSQVLIGTLILVASAALIFAQGFTGSSHHPVYDSQKPIPMALPEAYALAVTHVGIATNRFHCIAASCRESTSQWSTGWIFEFSDTNGIHAKVKVFFNKDVWADTNSAALLR